MLIPPTWTEKALCAGKPDQFCPQEDIMRTPRWVKVVAPQAAQVCLECPVFPECRENLLEQLREPSGTNLPVGVVAGVVTAEKKRNEIERHLAVATEKWERTRR